MADSALNDFYGDLTNNGGEVAGEDAVYKRQGAAAPPRRQGKEQQLGSSADAERQRAATLDNRSANKGRPGRPNKPTVRATR